MTAVDKIKAATAKLGPDEQYELFKWWTESTPFKDRQLAALKKDIEAGIEDIAQGRYKTYTEANVMELAEEVCRKGRERLNKSRENS